MGLQTRPAKEVAAVGHENVHLLDVGLRAAAVAMDPEHFHREGCENWCHSWFELCHSAENGQVIFAVDLSILSGPPEKSQHFDRY
jgi:hypothetical protein